MFSSERVPQLSITDSKVKWPLYFFFNYVQSVTQHCKQRTVEEVPPAIKYQSSRHGKYGQFHFKTFVSHHTLL